MAEKHQPSPEFKSSFAENIFKNKYALTQAQTWHEKARSIVLDVCGKGYHGQWDHGILSEEDQEDLIQLITEFKFMPGGRYIYYAGRNARFWNNCYVLMGEEDTREEWAALAERAMLCLTTGGGIGIDYSVFRPEGRLLSRTGGQASGPIPLMKAINEIGRNVMQGGSRRSALYASLNYTHDDAWKFLKVKNWHEMPIGDSDFTFKDAKEADFNFHAPLDMTNISINYGDEWLDQGAPQKDPLFVENCRQALMTGEPGFSFNFGDHAKETGRNACTELVSGDDSDVCNLGSLNLAAFDSMEDFKDAVRLASKFLVCGTMRAELPYDKVYEIREKNRRLGLGLMGIHEWLVKRGHGYVVTKELREWLSIYRDESERAANEHCDRFFLSRPVAYRAIAPTGTIGILASTTTGIEPLYATAFKRRYLVDGTKWKYEYVVDNLAQQMVNDYGVDPERIETASSLASNPEKRIKFQADIQDYVDMAISSTINLPKWGSEHNSEGLVESFAETLAHYAPRLRGFTAYPDGARGGQPITTVPYEEAIKRRGVVYEEHQDEQCKGGVCGI